MDVAATTNPTTVHFRSLTSPAVLSVLEQNYEYDLLEPEKLLRKYVGRTVTLVRMRAENGSTVSEEVKAELLAYNNGPVWKIGNEIVTGLHADHYRFPELPENLYSRPTLVWMLDNRGEPRQRVETSYLAGGLAWSADYVLTVARDDRSAELGGWVTLANNSGTSFKNAALQLIAGDLHRVSAGYQRDEERVARKMELAAAAPAAFAREAFSEYHSGRRPTPGPPASTCRPRGTGLRCCGIGCASGGDRARLREDPARRGRRRASRIGKG